MESELQSDDNGGPGPSHNVPEDDDDESDIEVQAALVDISNECMQ